MHKDGIHEIHVFSSLSADSVPHLGAYLHFLMDFAHTQPEDEYTLVTYEVCISARGLYIISEMISNTGCTIMYSTVLYHYYAGIVQLYQGKLPWFWHLLLVTLP